MWIGPVWWRRGAGGIFLFVASAWPWRHHTSKRMQRGPGAGVVECSGRVGVRVFGQGGPVVVLLPGIAASQTFYGDA